MNESEVLSQMKSTLRGLNELDLGYPLGTNIVRDANRANGMPPAYATVSGWRWINELYSASDGLSFPDVHVGYFIKPLERIVNADGYYEPRTVIGDSGEEVSVLPFGSTGGGSLFVVKCNRGEVMLLPPGEFRNGRYDGRGRKVRVIASSVVGFLDLLREDLEAFVGGVTPHAYISST